MRRFLVQSLILEEITAYDEGRAREIAHTRCSTRDAQFRHKVSQRIEKVVELDVPFMSRNTCCDDDDQIVALLHEMIATIKRKQRK